MSTDYVELVDYVAIAVEVTGLDVEAATKVANLGLADSALHAPAAGFGETDFYPDFVDKAAVLAVRLVKNHPLPDGNKRAPLGCRCGCWSTSTAGRGTQHRRSMTPSKPYL